MNSKNTMRTKPLSAEMEDGAWEIFNGETTPEERTMFAEWVIKVRALEAAKPDALKALRAKLDERMRWLEDDYSAQSDSAEVRYEDEARINECKRFKSWLDAAASEGS
jgi:hypothetical protein